MIYIATERTFRSGQLFAIGDSLESDTDPGFPFVPAAQYSEYAPVFEHETAGDAGFAVRGEGGRLVPVQTKATRLRNRSPHEPRF